MNGNMFKGLVPALITIGVAIGLAVAVVLWLLNKFVISHIIFLWQ